ncbi:entry exclusion lipoprotein TrbK [Pseudomonas oryzihabitans]|uniref:entry exclusion lipoprotein TrbK n=1 Tax=Pseudomonas oryzihabitans TaxID=47885 RepID=UPI00363C2F1B
MNKMMLLAGFAATTLGGCDNKPPVLPMPEVDEKNCQIEVIKNIDDKPTRETFAGLCSRRSPEAGGIAPTEKPLNWLELADPASSKEQEAKP